jgi:5-(carboxyamino)imidazole ribonucleotide synthase
MKNQWTADLKIGFLGAGQLARMSALEAAKYGFQIHSFSDRKDQIEPLEQVCPNHFKGSFESLDDLVEFAKQCHILTLENEFIHSGLLKQMVEKSGTPLFPTPEILSCQK